MLSHTIHQHIEYVLGKAITQTRSIGGGCISETYILTTADGSSLFLKTDPSPTDMFLKEAHGLQELQQAHCIRIPNIIHASRNLLLLEYITVSQRSSNKIFFETFGRQLAQLHKQTSSEFGFFEDNYIGSTPQKNIPTSNNWATFYFHNRLFFQYQLAEQQGYTTPELSLCFSNIEKKIERVLGSVHEPPSLLHGDLWNGNVLIDEHNNPVLIDPAVYYGHRETDLAMTKLFGGFPEIFYQSYNDEFPLLGDWEEREPLYQLYHILNHLNLFGTSYYHRALTVMNYYL